MNNEKVQALFNNIEKAVDEQKNATLELKKATHSANKIQHLNSDKVIIQKLINDFHAVNNNSQKVVITANEAIKTITTTAKTKMDEVNDNANKTIADIKKRSLFLHWTAMLTIVASSIATGLTIGVYGLKQDIIIDLDTHVKIKNKFGVIINNNEIIIPFDVIINKAEGVYFIQKK